MHRKIFNQCPSILNYMLQCGKNWVWFWLLRKISTGVILEGLCFMTFFSFLCCFSWSFERTVRIKTDFTQFEGKRWFKASSFLMSQIPALHLSLAEYLKDNTSLHTFSYFMPQQVTCDSLYVEIVSTQIGPTNISYCGLQGFSLKHIFNYGVKSLVPLGEEKGRIKSNPCAATTELKPKCDQKSLYFYGFS